MYEAQYSYAKRHPEKFREYARNRYRRIKEEDPDAWARYQAKSKEWRERNREEVKRKNKEFKRKNKVKAIEYLGGVCIKCGGEFHPAIYEFHHRNPLEKDGDPSKFFSLRWERIVEELNKCDLLCANCHRLEHHNWS